MVWGTPEMVRDEAIRRILKRLIGGKMRPIDVSLKSFYISLGNLILLQTINDCSEPGVKGFWIASF